MANPISQYLKETRTELNHVAWPTQTQTIVFTALVIGISLGVAAYVGALDYVFSGTLIRIVDASGNASAQNAVQVTQQPATQTTPAVTGPSFGIPSTNTSNPNQSQ